MPIDVTECRSCKAAIVWGITRNDIRMPLDAEPSPDGNVWLHEDKHVDVLGPFDILLHNQAEHPLRLPHHATCPDKELWKR